MSLAACVRPPSLRGRLAANLLPVTILKISSPEFGPVTILKCFLQRVPPLQIWQILWNFLPVTNVKIWAPEIDLPVTNGEVSILNSPVPRFWCIKSINFVEPSQKFLRDYRGIRVRYPPLISYWRVNFRRSNFHISYWGNFSENLPDLQRGDPLQKAIRPSNYSEIWRRNFQNSY